jgi:hypothetical protein
MKTLFLTFILLSGAAVMAGSENRVVSQNSEAYLQIGSSGESPAEEVFGVVIGKTQAILIVRNSQIHSFVVLPESQPGFTISKEGEDTYILFTRKSGPVAIPFDGLMFGPGRKVTFVDKAYLEKRQSEMNNVSNLLGSQK